MYAVSSVTRTCVLYHFLYNHVRIDMFCEVGFRQHLLDEEDSEEAICLPIPVIEDVEARRKQKLVFSELEVRYRLCSLL